MSKDIDDAVERARSADVEREHGGEGRPHPHRDMRLSARLHLLSGIEWEEDLAEILLPELPSQREALRTELSNYAAALELDLPASIHAENVVRLLLMRAKEYLG